MSSEFAPTREEIRAAQGRGDLSLRPGHAGLVAKLNPGVMRVSPMMTAILGYLLDQDWTEPAIVSMAVTSDGFLVSDGDFFGPATNLAKNLSGVAQAAGLSETEKDELIKLTELGVEGWTEAEHFTPLSDAREI